MIYHTRSQHRELGSVRLQSHTDKAALLTYDISSDRLQEKHVDSEENARQKKWTEQLFSCEWVSLVYLRNKESRSRQIGRHESVCGVVQCHLRVFSRAATRGRRCCLGWLCVNVKKICCWLPFNRSVSSLGKHFYPNSWKWKLSFNHIAKQNSSVMVK